MENKSYSYGIKMVGLILHMFFTVVLTMSICVLGFMIDKNIFEVTDIGTSNFLKSGYYTQCIQDKCDHLAEYLHLLRLGDGRSVEDNKRYLQYTDEFKSEDTNFCFWYKIDGKWYTNQPDMEDREEFDAERVLMEAKTMGNYLIYNMESKEFGTDIDGLSKHFFDSPNTQLYWPSENVILVIGVDTDLSAMDDLYNASMEYEYLYPWIKVGLLCALIGLIGWIVSLVYLVLAAGHRPDDREIHLSTFDRIKTEILIAGFLFITIELIVLIARISSTQLEISGLLVASGTICLVIDAFFILFFLSLVRLLKAERLWKNSLMYWLGTGLMKTFRERSVTIRVLVVFGIHMIGCFFLAVGTFYYGNKLCFFLLMILCGAECYIILREAVEHYHVFQCVESIRNGDLTAKLDLEEMSGSAYELAEAINNIGDGLVNAVADSTKNERMKADLITNVSHDIKTPLTSIINYVNLLKRETFEDERIKGYIKILDEKSLRLKQLTEDLVEASKVSSGNVKLEMQTIDLVEMVYQTAGEFNEKFEAKELTIVTKLPNNCVLVKADGRQLYRVIENLYNNVAKYALTKTRVYVELHENDEEVSFSIKNVSERELKHENGQTIDLTERFVRGDTARTTEGSGLGLSIAKNLTVLMGGKFDITIDGDLFKATITFKAQKEVEELDEGDNI